MIVIVNLGLGNLISLQRAFDKIKKKNIIIDKPLNDQIKPDLAIFLCILVGWQVYSYQANAADR